jgi:hypothetical protein
VGGSLVVSAITILLLRSVAHREVAVPLDEAME